MWNIGIYLTLFLCLSGCISPNEETLHIATAANMQFAMTEIVKEFEEETKIPCEVILGSSGKLYAQIVEGAPYDVFLSANMKFPNALKAKGLLVNQPLVYANGQLVLWTTLKHIQPSLEILKTEEIRHIAIANPQTAPYGKAARYFLKNHQLWKELQPKLVFGEGIGQTNQFLITGAAEIGFTAKSVVLSKQMKNVGRWIQLNPDTYPPIAQGAGVLSQSKHPIESQLFLQFLQSEKVKGILDSYGYHVVN